MTNIKSLFLGLLFLTVGETTFGQTYKFEAGVEGSPALSFLRINDNIDNNHKPTIGIGFTGGLFFQYNFKKIISLRTNIAFERKGSMTSTPPKPDYVPDIHAGTPSEIITNTNYDYLTLPILARATFGKKITYFVNAGPYFGYLIKRTFVSGEGSSAISGDNTWLNERFDTGISAGFGLSCPLTSKFAFSFEVRNNLGLYNISAVPVGNNGTIKINSTNLLLGFTYKFGQRTSDTK
jgi:hypothetical protein